MKNPVDIFNDWVTASSGQLAPRLHPLPPEYGWAFSEQLEAFSRRILDSQRRFMPGRGMTIYVDFLNDGQINAAADIWEGIGLIGVNKGLVLLPIDTFMRMLSHPKSWPEIGNASAEKQTEQHEEGLFTNHDELLAFRSQTGRNLQEPIDAARFWTARACCDIVSGFIAIHELTHLLHGHVEHRYESLGQSCYIELFRAAQDRPDRAHLMDIQAIELYADTKAVEVTFGGLISKSNHPFLQTTFSNPEKRAYLWGFAMYVLFRLWGLEIDPDDLEGDDHPPAAIRFQFAADAAVHEWLKRCPGRPISSFWGAVSGGLRAAEMSLQFCGTQPTVLPNINDPVIEKYMNGLTDHHNNILVPKLRPYRHLVEAPAEYPSPFASVV